MEASHTDNKTQKENASPATCFASSDLESQSTRNVSRDKIENWRDVRSAFLLSFTTQKKHFLTAWIHVPIGVMFLLFIAWALRLAINAAPFRFPAPVIAMLIIFFALLALDWLSQRYPTSGNSLKDQEMANHEEARHRRRFVDPVMIVLAPPCEFCLRNMSVMFTPSFILIPAREIIPPKEIGLIAAWFAITQVIGYVIPVLLNWGLNYVYDAFKPSPKPAPSIEEKSDGQNVQPTLAGVDFEKGKSYQGDRRLSNIATGLSGLTANVIAPITHIPYHINEDVRRQIESSAMEFARQQGDPAVTCSGYHRRRHHRLHYQGLYPQSDVSRFEHHDHRRRFKPSHTRSRSMVTGSVGLGAHNTRSNSFSATRPSARPVAELGVQSADTPLEYDPLSPTASATFAEPIGIIQGRRGSASVPNLRELAESSIPSDSFSADKMAVQWQPDWRLQQKDLASLDTFSFGPRVSTLGSEPALQNEKSTTIEAPHLTKSKDPSKVVFQQTDPFATARSQQFDRAAPGDEAGTRSVSRRESTVSDDNQPEEDLESAVERLSSWINDLITPTIYFAIFIIGIPLFFLLNVALPLFLAINCLTFLAAITIIPPRVRRFAHPILTTSIATVFIIWAFAAMKGIGLKRCLNSFYSVDAKYDKLWTLEGYNGPIPGAGDVLFSLLDAGIIALAIPMYRYRHELRESLVRMILVLTPCAALSLFFWNWIAKLMGMDLVRSLAFSARFMSTPLAIELANNVGADTSITVILVVVTGVIAAICKEQFFFRLMRVRKDDHLTVGLAMGATSGAIGANSLIASPQTMAIASLAFVIFGTMLLIATAIPPIVTVMRALAG